MAFTYDIRAMLRKFGVVTVMDVKAYKAERYTEDGSGYSKGEWDNISTFTEVEAQLQEAKNLGTEDTFVMLSRPVKASTTVTCNNESITQIVVDSTDARKISFSNGLAAAATVKFTYTAAAGVKAPLFQLDTLKIANINSEGPTKSITGGQNADVLLKYGKTFTVEMQDALGRYDVLDNIYGVNFSSNAQYAAITDRFPAEITIVGTTFVIDQKTGAKQPINVVLPIFLGDGIFNLTQDAEGDATLFDLNGSLLKFNGLDGSSGTPVNSHEGLSNVGAQTDYIYGAGEDNEFYFLCTKEGLDLLSTQNYAAAKEAQSN